MWRGCDVASPRGRFPAPLGKPKDVCHGVSAPRSTRHNHPTIATITPQSPHNHPTIAPQSPHNHPCSHPGLTNEPRFNLPATKDCQVQANNTHTQSVKQLTASQSISRESPRESVRSAAPFQLDPGLTRAPRFSLLKASDGKCSQAHTTNAA